MCWDHLAANGWLYDEGDAAKSDRPLASFPKDVLAWVQSAQPKAWDAGEVVPRGFPARVGYSLAVPATVPR
ncbi:MAG: hypothetical protein ACHRXM_23035 [Isosphaerales bacterium]